MKKEKISKSSGKSDKLAKAYTEDNKLTYVELYRNGKSVASICEEYGIPKSTLYCWIHLSESIQSSSNKVITMRQHDHLLTRLKRLEQENQIFKLSKCTLSAPLEEKLQEIKRLKDQFPIRALCDVLQVRRSNFYHFLYRGPEMTQVERENVLYRERIAHIFEQSQQRFGADKIKVILAQEGFQVSPRRIKRLMNEMELKCNRKRPPRKHTPEYRQYYRNKLNREFEQSAPNQVRVSDITY